MSAPIRGAATAFVVGQRKSGSTWLINLLSLHPDVRGLKETHLFKRAATAPHPAALTHALFTDTPWGENGLRPRVRHWLQGRLGRLLSRVRPGLGLSASERPVGRLDLPRSARRRLRRRLASSATLDQCSLEFFDSLREALAPRRYLIEKSPSHILHLEPLRRLFPQSPLLCIHRDGRDVVVSERHFAPLYEGRQLEFAVSCTSWSRAMRAEIAAAARWDMHRCSFEELLADTPAALRRVLAFLDLRADHPLIADLVRRASFEFVSGRAPGTERRSFYRKGVAGDWRTHFSAGDKAVFKEIAGDLLIELGYERDDHW